MPLWHISAKDVSILTKIMTIFVQIKYNHSLCKGYAKFSVNVY